MSECLKSELIWISDTPITVRLLGPASSDGSVGLVNFLTLTDRGSTQLNAKIFLHGIFSIKCTTTISSKNVSDYSRSTEVQNAVAISL